MHAYFGNPIIPGTLGNPTEGIKGLLTFNSRPRRLNETNTWFNEKHLEESNQTKGVCFLGHYFSLEKYKKYGLMIE
jgi:hypothetical protein